ncbi:hypothetical protein FXO38_28463 [Capsicum annuum]|nr:uncharacterized protein LOC107855743 isoform X2 [Capsicum annuum]XP_047254485.1 uncharacterized protein LOC107855743 isoform X2 [Capsicum annuum]KAF3628017.1 hypothetical protein FXO38_28463 [Capsicum annuum]
MSMMPHQIQEYYGQKGMWMYLCIRFKKYFSSSQAIAGHTKRHFKDGWVKGTPQSRKFVKLSDYQQQLGFATTSCISNQQVVSAGTSEMTQQMLINFKKEVCRFLEAWQLNLHVKLVRDLMVLARIRDRLIGKKQETIWRVLASIVDKYG